MTRARAATTAAVLFGAVAFGAPSASAFERSTVEDDPTTPLFWRYRTVTVRPVYGSCADQPAEVTMAAIGRSILTWNLAAEGCSDFLLVDGGEASGTTTNLDGGDPDMENRIVWRSTPWPEEVPVGTLALTTVVYRKVSGQLIDADIDLNDVSTYWTDPSTSETAVTDIENTMTHELGHLLGLAHVPDPEATMFGSADDGDIEKRTLAQDDIDGLCFIYPRDQPTPDAPEFRSMPLTGGCSAAHGEGSPLWIAWIVLLAFIRSGGAARASA